VEKKALSSTREYKTIYEFYPDVIYENSYYIARYMDEQEENE